MNSKTIVTLFGTRPEVIKLAPVIHELEKRSAFRTINVTSAQHRELLYPFVDFFRIRIDHDLHVMQEDQSPSQVFSRTLSEFGACLDRLSADLVLIQGDTTTAAAGALAAFYRKIPVGHVEAGLRSGDVTSPFPEEINRRLITRLATFHFAPTPGNRMRLLEEAIPEDRIFVTGNPGVDALEQWLAKSRPSSSTEPWRKAAQGLKKLVLTTHRRESFGNKLAENLCVLRDFVTRHRDVALLFPVHANPEVQARAKEILGGIPRIHLLSPLGYAEFMQLLSESWLIVSDSGGVQEEVPTLGKALLVLRDVTERPEVIECGSARLVGNQVGHLEELLEEALKGGSWVEKTKPVSNPFGQGNSAAQIADVLEGLMFSSLRGERTVPAGVPVTIVVPCYNEEPMLPHLSETLQSVQRALETHYRIKFIFVDDASTDQTYRLLCETLPPAFDAQIIRHERNQGVAGAILTGIRNAESEIVCSIDADCTYDPHELGKMIPLLTEGVDMVTASPFHPLGHVQNVPGWRRGLSRVSSWLYRRALNQKLYTYTSCFRVYRRSKMMGLDVKDQGFSGIAEMLALLDLAGSRIVEHPSTLRSRWIGRSKMQVSRQIFRHWRLLGRIVWLRAVKKPDRVRARKLTTSTRPLLTTASRPSSEGKRIRG
ncbi:MAG: UDP-N-acetylglucosamine 2-epimerase (non-hydrolyzing) [Acidobacteriia bacterium]|nr:UDP-N-acetylglucosamine 2-epimerase (non-hydrolyzing) [Terriglobia bacterium]